MVVVLFFLLFISYPVTDKGEQPEEDEAYDETDLKREVFLSS